MKESPMSITHGESPQSLRVRLLTTGRLVLAGTLLVGLAATGCSSGAATNNDDPSASGTMRVIDPWFGADNKGSAEFGKVVDRFHETYPNVKVERDSATFGDLSQKMTTSVISGQNYDVVLAGFAWVPPLADLGAIQDMSKLGMTKDQVSAELGPEGAGLIQPGLYEDALYGIPLVASGRIVAYRKSAFVKAGLDPNKPPKTLAEIEDYAKKLTIRDDKGNIKQSGFTFNTPAGNYRQSFIQTLGALGEPLYVNGTDPNFGGATGVQALDWMKSMLDAKTFNFGETDPSGVSLVYTGKAAMGIADTYIDCSADGVGKAACDDIGYFNLQDKAGAMFVGGAIASVGAGTKLPDASMAFIKALREESALEAISKANNYIPLSSSPEAAKFAASNPASAFFYSNLPNAVFEGGPTNWLDLRGAFGPEIDSVLLGKSTSQEALDRLTQQARQ